MSAFEAMAIAWFFPAYVVLLGRGFTLSLRLEDDPPEDP